MDNKGQAVMRREELLDALRQRPFQPIRLHVSDGATFEIRHPKTAFIMRHAVLVVQPDPDDLPPAIDRYQRIDLLHITRMESFDWQPQTGDNGR